jgi:hypothetical protein
MMRKIYIIAALLIVSMSGYAYSSVQNWLGLSPMAYATMQLDDAAVTTPALGVGGALGLNYQLKMNQFIMELGVEGAYGHYRVGLENMDLSYQMIDTKGTPFEYKGLVTNRVDMCNMLSVRVPLMFGVEWHHVYVKAGAKVSLALMGNGKSVAKLTTTGKYDIFYEEIQNTPTHGFVRDKAVESKSKFVYGLDVSPQLEFGLVMNNKSFSYRNKGHKMHLGVYASYGLMNALPTNRESKVLEGDVSQYMRVNMNHVYTTNEVTKLNQLEVGVRFQVFFQMRKGASRYAY